MRVEEKERSWAERDFIPKSSPQYLGLWIGVLVVLYLCWLLVEPFLPALAWAFALSLIAHPFHRWLQTKLWSKNLSTTASVFLTCLVLVVPTIFLIAALVQEVAQGAKVIANPRVLSNLRDTLEHRAGLGPVLRWVDLRVDLPKEFAQAARGMMTWVYSLTSSIVTGSAWVTTQIVTMVVLLFYFLRDGKIILGKLRSILPWTEEETDRIFSQITNTIQVSLYGKLIVAAIQGSLGGLIFWWLSLPAPAFWGFVMALLSVLPVLGAFVIWLPAALILILQGLWVRALVLTAWGILIVHPIDNFLGPVLVGNRLQIHTLLIFFSVLGGMAAFGASGVVLGPVIMAIAVALFEVREASQKPIPDSLRAHLNG